MLDQAVWDHATAPGSDAPVLAYGFDGSRHDDDPVIVAVHADGHIRMVDPAPYVPQYELRVVDDGAGWRFAKVIDSTASETS